MKKNFYLLLLMLFVGITINAQWSSDPAENLKLTGLAGEEVIPKVRLAPNGDYYVGYFSSENGNYNVRLQRMDNQGNKLWDAEGLLVSSHPAMTWLTDWDMAVDHENHAILTWQDIRMGGNNNVVAYRIAPDGTFVWGPDGIMLSNNASFNVTPTIAITAANNAVIAWMADNTLIRQKISPAGVKLWGENGIIMSSTTIRYTWPQLMPVGADDILMKYYQDTGVSWSPTRHVFLQRFNSDGQGVWASPSVISNAGAITAWTQILPMISDGNEGLIVTWHDYRVSGTIASGWVQHINSSGQALLQANGVKISEADNMNQFYPQVAKPANDQNIFVYWNEVNGDQNQFGIYAQKISPAGERLWSDFGKVIFPVTSQALLPQGLFSVVDDVVLIYEHYFDGITTSLRAMRLDNLGNAVWEPEEAMVSSAQSSKVHLDNAAFDGNQWVFAWEDDRNGDVDLFAQNLRPDGTLGNPSAMGTLAMQINIEGNMANVDETTIQIGSQTYHPEPDGSIDIQLPADTYTVTVSHAYTQTVVLENVVISENVITMQEVSLLMLRSDLHVKAVDQAGNPVLLPVIYSVAGPENTYTGTITNGEVILTNVPHGPYGGSATLDGSEFVEVYTLLDGSNQELIFVFIIDGISETTPHMPANISPNPITENSILRFTSVASGNVLIIISDESGRILQQTQLSAVAGENRLILNKYLQFGKLRNGLYTLQLVSERQQASLKIVKTN